jgi:small-conductance mechanosensitive channel
MGAMIGKGFIIARGKTKQSKKIYGYVASAVHYGLLALALLITQQFGIEATSILALFGAVGFGLGLALQGHSPIYLLLWCYLRKASIS